MKSIRRTITGWLLVGLGVLGLAGGAAVYLTSRAAMMAGIDRDNQGLARQVRALSRSEMGGGHGGGPGWRHEQEASAELIPDGVFYQVWRLEGDVVTRSANLEGQDLPRRELHKEVFVFETVEMASGRRVRMAVTEFATGRMGRGGMGHGPPMGAGGGMNEPMLVAVARDLAGFEEQSRRLLWGVTVIGLVAGLGVCLLLRFALREGLKPLQRLGALLGEVDSSSLDVRFGGEGAPRELQPVMARFDELMERLEEGFLRERRFSADLAHELRTPISEMQVLAELAIEWPAERSDEQMVKIQEVALRMQGVVDTMLELARLEGGETGEEGGQVDLAGLIEEVWSPLRELAERRRLDVRFEVAAGEMLRGRVELWRHLLGNLLANAAEYAVEDGRIEVRCLEGGLQVRNSVEGLEEGRLERMFERFWRADESRTGRRHCGLGLSLAKACAEAMHYRITARLEGQGEMMMLVIDLIDGTAE